MIFNSLKEHDEDFINENKIFKTQEILGYRIATQHNLSFYNNLILDAIEAINNNNPPKPLPISRTINIPYSIIINPTAAVTKKTLEITERLLNSLLKAKSSERRKEYRERLDKVLQCLAVASEDLQEEREHWPMRRRLSNGISINRAHVKRPYNY